MLWLAILVIGAVLMTMIVYCCSMAPNDEYRKDER